MKKIITALTTAIMISSVSITAHATEILEKDYIKSEIWEDVWNGKGDNGKIFPEGSYKYHLLDEWVETNYGSDDYDWSEIGELRYSYKDYYDNLTEDWDFNDDKNGNWTIETEDNLYYFELSGNQWNMIDINGNTVDMFPVYSTLKVDNVPVPNKNNTDNGADANRVIGQVGEYSQNASDSVSDNDKQVSIATTQNISEVNTEQFESNLSLYLIVGAIVIAITTGIIIYKKKK